MTELLQSIKKGAGLNADNPTTLQAKVDTEVPNKGNLKLISDFDAFMDATRLSGARCKNNLKLITQYGAWLAERYPKLSFRRVNSRELHILSFLNEAFYIDATDPKSREA